MRGFSTLWIACTRLSTSTSGQESSEPSKTSDLACIALQQQGRNGCLDRPAEAAARLSYYADLCAAPKVGDARVLLLAVPSGRRRPSGWRPLGAATQVLLVRSMGVWPDVQGEHLPRQVRGLQMSVLKGAYDLEEERVARCRWQRHLAERRQCIKRVMPRQSRQRVGTQLLKGGHHRHSAVADRS